MAHDKELLESIEAKIVAYPDFPKAGVLFRDIMPIMGDCDLFNSMIDIICKRVSEYKIDRVLGIESRGFLIGPLVAQKLKLPFGPIRKKGKLPGELFSVEYQLEYGKDTLEVQKEGLPKDSNCLVVDDLIATGGSLEAAEKLVKLSGSKVTAVAVVVELKALEGKKKIPGTPLVTLFSY